MILPFCGKGVVNCLDIKKISYDVEKKTNWKNTTTVCQMTFFSQSDYI